MRLLEGATLRRADVADDVAAVEVRLPGETLVIIVAAISGARGVGFVTPEARRTAWGARLPATSARKAHFEGGHIAGVGPWGLEIVRGTDAARALLIEGARIVMREPSGAPCAEESERDAYAARGESLVEAIADQAL